MEGTTAGRGAAGEQESLAAQRSWWDGEARDYYTEHGDFLGDADFVWGPEGWTEAELGLLHLADGQRVLEIGGGAAQCARWVSRTYAAQVVSSDLSIGMLKVGAAIDAAAGSALPLVQCDAGTLPFADASFDTVFTSYGAIPFVADSAGLMREAARVLRPGGRFVFANTHPVRWALPDVPGPEGLVVTHSYFDRQPYVERDAEGHLTYVEHHRTMGDRIRELVAAGLVIEDLIEPEWPLRNEATWGGWSPQRGRLIPGTLIVVATRST